MRLTALVYVYSKPKIGAYWKCKCSCGSIKITSATNLLQKRVQSCGCLPAGMPLGKIVTHGFSSRVASSDQVRFSSIYGNMIQRCTNPKNDNYPNYGGRGITVCSRWLEFKNFIEDLWESYLKHVKKFGIENTTLGRQAVDGNYELSNVTWETLAQQGKSQRCSIRSKDKKLHKIWKARLQGEIYYMLHKVEKLDTYHPLIGCTVGELREHIAKQFIDGMTWNNHGIYTKGNTKVWHIDHIIPCYKFDLTKKKDRLVCFNIKNLRPWWAIDNFSKIR